MVKSKLVHAATVAGAALALSLLVAACGGGGGDPEGVASLTDTSGQSATDGDGAATTGEQDPQDAALDYAECMREHGVDMPDPGPDGGINLDVEPGDEAKVQEAQEACEDILQSAGPQLSEAQQSAMQDAQLAFARCMREHGIDMPDPQFGADGRVTQEGGPGSAVDPDDPKFQEAQEACRPIIEKAASEAGLPEPEGGLGVQRSGERS